MERSIIVIPVYKKEINTYEKLSLSRCFEIFSKHPIAIVAADNLELNNYESIIGKGNYIIERFGDWYFQNIEGYNSLLKSALFFKRFSLFDTMLIYQLDAYVFSDELVKWNNKKYDYIGAPWFENWGKGGSEKITGVGNGGFSLRNIKKAFIISKQIQKIGSIRKFWFKYKFQSILSFEHVIVVLYPFLLSCKIKKLNALFKQSSVNEDIWWSQLIPEVFTCFRVASIKDAIQFSFEVNPSFLFRMNNNVLPFGCHAWEKYDPEFWKSFIINTH